MACRYSRPRKHYYYSSRRYNYGGYRGKRDTAHMEELAELHRIKREIEDVGFDMNGWYRDMTEQDQDSCGKKLICELSAKQAKGSVTVSDFFQYHQSSQNIMHFSLKRVS